MRSHLIGIIKEHQRRVDSLKEELSQAEKEFSVAKRMLEEFDKCWRPEEGETYYYANAHGGVNSTVYQNQLTYNNYVGSFNCFKTKEEAQIEAEKIYVRRYLENIAKRLNGNREVDLTGGRHTNYYLEYSQNCGITLGTCSLYNAGHIICLDQRYKDVAIQEIGEERLKRYLLNGYKMYEGTKPIYEEAKNA